MNGYKFFSSLFVRTPLYSIVQYNTINKKELLKSEKFQLALLLASKSLYDELEKKQFDYRLLNNKQKQTIWKYVNRASFRSTPFGLFSSFFARSWGIEAGNELILENTSPRIRLDFSIMKMLWERLLKNQILASSLYRTNHLYSSASTILQRPVLMISL